MSKVSPSAILHSTDISRFRFDVATSTPGSNDPIGMSGGVSELLVSSGTFQVSHFDFLHLANIYRNGFDSSMSTLMPNESVWMVWMLDGWPG